MKVVRLVVASVAHNCLTNRTEGLPPVLCLVLVNGQIMIQISALTHPDYMFTTASASVTRELCLIFKSKLYF